MNKNGINTQMNKRIFKNIYFSGGLSSILLFAPNRLPVSPLLSGNGFKHWNDTSLHREADLGTTPGRRPAERVKAVLLTAAAAAPVSAMVSPHSNS